MPALSDRASSLRREHGTQLRLFFVGARRRIVMESGRGYHVYASHNGGFQVCQPKACSRSVIHCHNYRVSMPPLSSYVSSLRREHGTQLRLFFAGARRRIVMELNSRAAWADLLTSISSPNGHLESLTAERNLDQSTVAHLPPIPTNSH